MLILGIDTATLVCSVGLTREGQLVGEHTLNIHKTHSQRLLPLINQLLMASGFQPGDLEGIAVSMGPGSFTGIRIGIATAKGLAQALDIPLVGVPTLDVIAAPFIHTDCLVCPILDARRQQVYTAFYRSRGPEVRRVSEYMALSLESLVELLQQRPEQGFLFPGDALEVYAPILKEKLGAGCLELPRPYRLNRGGFTAYLGHKEFLSGSENQLYSLVPLYVRKPEAEVKWDAEREKEG